MTYGQLMQKEKASYHIRQLEKLDPVFVSDPRARLKPIPLREDIVEAMIEGFEKAKKYAKK